MSNTTEPIEWKAPPEPQPSRADRVASALREKPGEWALIARHESMQMLPWWQPIAGSPLYETRIVNLKRGQMFGPREIYARFVGDDSR